MIYFYISILLWIIAAICNAVMDKTENEIQFNDSRFYKKDPLFWCKTKSSTKPFIKFTKYRLDAWHLFKSIMIISLVVSDIMLILTNPFLIFVNPKWYSYIMVVALYGAIWNTTFNIFYNKIFKKHE